MPPANDNDLILQELVSLEISIMKSAGASDLHMLNNLLSDGFIEFGASGKIYNKQQTIDILEKRDAASVQNNWAADSFICHQITGNVYLLMYSLQRGNELTKRTSIWQKSGGQWQILFHHGTAIKE
jgi:hypothetical protein